MTNCKRKPGTMFTLNVKGHGYKFTREQKKVFCEVYPVTQNWKVCEMFGLSASALYKIAKRWGLKKDTEAVKLNQSVSRLKNFKVVRDRRRWGMDVNTNYHLPSEPYTMNQARLRSRAKKLGYILGDIDEKFGERYTIYWDSETERSALVENGCQRNGLTVKELK